MASIKAEVARVTSSARQQPGRTAAAGERP
jgi:hypothetical protein